MKDLLKIAYNTAGGVADSLQQQASGPVKKRQGRIERYLEEDPGLAAMYDKFQRHAAPVITSNYDITSRCNLHCEGCLFFEGTDYQGHCDDQSPDAFDTFFAREAARGVNYPYFAGGEPALEQDRLRIAARHFNRGMIFTNGTLRIDPALPFTIHVSLWGDADATRKLRGGSVFHKSLTNYAGDKRATFIYTVNHQNIDQIPSVVSICRDQGVRVSFNHFSATEQYIHRIELGSANDAEYFRFSNHEDNLRLTDADHLRARDILDRITDDFPETVIYSHHYNAWISRPGSLYNIDPLSGQATDCPISNAGFHRHYHVDLTESTGKCCSPNIDCRDCRAYAIAHATLRHRVREFLGSREDFAKWLDIINTWCRMYLIGWDDIEGSKIKQVSNGR